MARKKVKLTWIANENARNVTLRKRRQSLVKKVKELSILCGVPAFCAVYCPDEPEPTVWPTNRAEAEQVLARFLALPAVEQTKKMTNQETYLRDNLSKLQDSHRHLLKVLNELELAYLMDQVHQNASGLDRLDLFGLNRLSLLLEERLREIRKKAEYFEVELKGPSPQGLNNNEAETYVNGAENNNNNVVVPENPNLLWQDDYIMNNIIDQGANNNNGNGNEGIVQGLNGGGAWGFHPLE